MHLVDAVVEQVQHVVIVDVLEDDVVERAGVDHDLGERGAQVEGRAITGPLVDVAFEQVAVEVERVREHRADRLHALQRPSSERVGRVLVESKQTKGTRAAKHEQVDTDGTRHKEGELARGLAKADGDSVRTQLGVEVVAQLERVEGAQVEQHIVRCAVHGDLEAPVGLLHVIPRVRDDHIVQHHPHLLVRQAGDQVRWQSQVEVRAAATVTLVGVDEE